MRRTSAELTKRENSSSTPSTAAAPAKAPPMRAMRPQKPNTPPKTRSTTATPALAPPDMPIIEGPASGLLKHVCISRPATASAAPASMAVTSAGKRVSTTMKCAVASPLPAKAPSTSDNGRSTPPASSPGRKSATVATASATIDMRLRAVIGLCDDNISTHTQA